MGGKDALTHAVPAPVEKSVELNATELFGKIDVAVFHAGLLRAKLLKRWQICLQQGGWPRINTNRHE
jgi:hypothetical protein